MKQIKVIIAFLLALTVFVSCAEEKKPKERILRTVSSYDVDLYVHGIDGDVTVFMINLQGDKNLTQHDLTDNHAVVNVYDNNVTREVAITIHVNGHPIFGEGPVTIPTVFFGNCQLTIDDYGNQSGTHALNVTVGGDRTISASNCNGRKSSDLVFNYEGPSTSNTLSCVAFKAGSSVKNYIQPFIKGVSIVQDATVPNWYMCNVDLNGDSLVNDDESVRLGNTLMVQGQTLGNHHVKTKDGITGYLFYVGSDGTVNLPPKPETVKVKKDTVDVNIEVRMYDPYDNLRIICDFNNWVAVDMTATNNSLHTYTYTGVKTGDQYACNLINRATGIQIFNRSIPQSFVFLVNGVQVIRPKGDNLNVVIDEYGEIVVNYVPVHMVCDASITFSDPVFGMIGNIGRYESFPMVQNGNNWEASLLVEEGIHEFNVAWEGGAYKALYKAFPSGKSQDCDLSINNVLINTTVPFANSYNWISLILDNAVSEQTGTDQVIVNIGVNLAP